MSKASRKRWDGNVRSMAIIAKPDEEITEDDLRFLRENYTSAGGLLPNAYSGGAFFTPTHVARFIVEALRGLSGGSFRPGSRFLEPSCGSGVFLEHLPEDGEITALELDETSARVSSLLYPGANVIECDALLHGRRDYYDYVVGNPPFGVNIDVAADDLPDTYETLRVTKGRAKGKSEIAFIELAIKAAKPGGYIAMILPKGIAYSQQSAKTRDLMRETCWHVATIELPGETFAHVGTSVGTHVHILRKVTPNARKIYVKYTQKGPDKYPFHIAEQTDEKHADTFWYEGQMPVLQAAISDIGYDKDGKPTDKWDDGLTQLDELAEAFEDTLMRENSDPSVPFEIVRGRDVIHAFDTRVPLYESWRVKDGLMAYWNVLTLGRGEDIETDSGKVSSFDFEWQDRIVNEYYAEVSD